MDLFDVFVVQQLCDIYVGQDNYVILFRHVAVLLEILRFILKIQQPDISNVVIKKCISTVNSILNQNSLISLSISLLHLLAAQLGSSKYNHLIIEGLDLAQIQKLLVLIDRNDITMTLQILLF